MITLKQKVEDLGLYTLSTIQSGCNGYPCNFKDVVCGFSSWDDVQNFVDTYGGEPICLYKKQGWDYMERRYHVDAPFNIDESWYGDDFSIIWYRDFYDELDYVQSYLLPLLEMCESLSEMNDIIVDCRRLWNYYCELTNGQGMVIQYNTSYYGTICTDCLEWSFDSQTYMIGVLTDSNIEFCGEIYKLNQLSNSSDLLNWCSESQVGEYTRYYQCYVFHTNKGCVQAYADDLNNYTII